MGLEIAPFRAFAVAVGSGTWYNLGIEPMESEAQRVKKYKLLGADGKIYESETPGEYGGNGNLKIYGRMDCGTALAYMKRHPGVYEAHRVFFADERTALAAGYRPCGNCLRKKYAEYTANPDQYRKKFGL